MSAGELAVLAVVGLLVAVVLGGMVWSAWCDDGTEQFLRRAHQHRLAAHQHRLAAQQQPEPSDAPAHPGLGGGR